MAMHLSFTHFSPLTVHKLLVKIKSIQKTQNTVSLAGLTFKVCFISYPGAYRHHFIWEENLRKEGVPLWTCISSISKFTDNSLPIPQPVSLYFDIPVEIKIVDICLRYRC